MPADYPFDIRLWTQDDHPPGSSDRAPDPDASSYRDFVHPEPPYYLQDAGGFSSWVHNLISDEYPNPQVRDYGTSFPEPTRFNAAQGDICIDPTLLKLDADNSTFETTTPPFLNSDELLVDCQQYDSYSPTITCPPDALSNDWSTYRANGAVASSVGSTYHNNMQPNTARTHTRGYVFADENQFPYVFPSHEQLRRLGMHDDNKMSQPRSTREIANLSPHPCSRSRSRSRSIQGPKLKCVYLNCIRSQQEGFRYCDRHNDKFERNNAGPPIFHMNNWIDSFDAASRAVFPRLPALNIINDDVQNSKSEHEWVRDFIDAANKPYTGTGTGDYHEFYSRQQKVYNGKGFDGGKCKSRGYNSWMVTARMRYLYQSALRLHTGGFVVYPVGGDNEGYGRPDTSLKFSERLKAIISILEQNKRICMDVIEGRGVAALVASPNKYMRRKTSNKDTNERKQKKQKLGERVQRKRKAKGKHYEDSAGDSDDYSVSDDEESVKAEVHHSPAADVHPPPSTYNTLRAETVPKVEIGRWQPLVGRKRKR